VGVLASPLIFAMTVGVMAMTGLGGPFPRRLLLRCAVWTAARMWWALRSSLGSGWGHLRTPMAWVVDLVVREGFRSRRLWWWW
jgi:hypothetical protein